MTKPGKLRKVFMAAVLGATMLSGAFLPIMKTDFLPPPEPGNLTEGEKALVKSVFGNSINVDIVQKKVGQCSDETHKMEVGNKREIIVCTEAFYSQDYSREKDLHKYGLFMHEMTHIWQFQTNWLENYCRGYSYSLDAQRPFSDYCVEQQGSIVEDYARRFLYPGGGSSRYHVDTPETDRLLHKLVEDKFPAARETRLALPGQKEKQVKVAIRAPIRRNLR